MASKEWTKYIRFLIHVMMMYLFIGIFKVSGFENTSEEDYMNSYKVNAVGPALLSKVSPFICTNT